MVKNQLHDVPTSQEHHATHEVIPHATPPNFNSIQINNTKQRLRAASAAEQRKVGYYTKNRKRKTMFETVDFKIGSRHADKSNEGRLDPKNLYLGPPMIDTKTFKQEFLAGDKDAVMYHDKKVKESSAYQ